MERLWTTETEKFFLNRILQRVPVEEIFYKTDDEKYYIYWPKNYSGRKYTIQTRNSYIGNYTEDFCLNLISSIVTNKGLFAVKGAVCKEIGLIKASPADLVVSTSPKQEQDAHDIKIIFEVKMSLVWNWEYHRDGISVVGDFHSHLGSPSILRSDSILKAIGKSALIRSNKLSNNIPIIVIGNSPVTANYIDKIDTLKDKGLIQAFWSLNPRPTNDNQSLKQSPNRGYYRFDSMDEMDDEITRLIASEETFISTMISKETLGDFVKISSLYSNNLERANKLIELIGQSKDER